MIITIKFKIYEADDALLSAYHELYRQAVNKVIMQQHHGVYLHSPLGITNAIDQYSKRWVIRSAYHYFDKQKDIYPSWDPFSFRLINNCALLKCGKSFKAPYLQVKYHLHDYQRLLLDHARILKIDLRKIDQHWYLYLLTQPNIGNTDVKNNQGCS